VTAAEALRVDEVLSDPLGVPQGLDDVLRKIERGALRHRVSLAPLAARADAVPAVRASAQELERFLEDEARSPLLRALRRPLAQIAPGTPGGRSLQRCWDGLRARAEEAAELQSAMDGLRDAVARVRERFADELPRSTREILSRERLDDASLARVVRARDALPLHRRLRRAESELDRLWSMADAGAGSAMQRGAEWDEEVGPGELLALLELRLRERGRLLHDRAEALELRLGAARQVLGLGRVHARPTSEPVHAFAQELAKRVLRDTAGLPGGEDLALWDELLGAASDALHRPGRRGAWTARLDPPEPPAERDFGSTHFVVPIDDGYALITPALQSSVRVFDRAVDLGRTVEAAAFLEHGDTEILPLARMDVAPLFDGLDGEPAWYATARRAQLQVIARAPRGWIARIARRGALERGTAAWVAEPRGTDRLRVLGTLAAPPAETPLAVGPAGGAVAGFCGVLSVPVAAPLAECPTAWLRLPSASGWAEEAVRAEEECFRTVARRTWGTVPVRAGRGRVEARGLQGPLYVPPLGVRLDELPTLRSWLSSASARPLLECVARLWLRLHGAACGIGVYHPDALVFSLGWRPENAAGPAAHAVVAEAPFAAVLGRGYRAPPRDEALHPLYRGLGCRVLPSAVTHGAAALPETEAQGFALFALDALARQPMPLSGIVHAEALGEMVPDFATHFEHPETAIRLAKALRANAPASHVIEWIHALAGSKDG
jgi:hypothetical protein